MMSSATRPRLSTLFSIAILALAALAPPALAETPSFLGNQGEIYRVETGELGELFADPEHPSAHRPILALDVVGAEGQRELLAVPGTEGPGSDRLLVALYEKSTGLLEILHEVRDGKGRSSIALVNFDGETFSESWEITSAIHPLGETRVAITHDSYELELADGDSIVASRRVIHVVQLEGRGEEAEVFYTPVILVEGSYIGWTETFSLTELAADAETTLKSEPPEELFETLDLATTDNGRKVMVSFASSLDGSLSILEIGILPVELVHLSDEIRDHIVDLTADGIDPAEVSSLADDARNQIINVGYQMNFNPDVIDYLASDTEAWIQESAESYGDDLDALAQDLRDRTLDLVAALFAVDLSYAEGEDGLPILEIDLGNLGDASPASQVLELRRPLHRTIPEIGLGELELHTSPDGRELAVSWYDAESGALSYVESTADGWTEPRTLELGDDLSRGEARTLLERRLE